MGKRLTRLTEPLVREGGVLRPASWSVALDRAADGFRSTRDTYGGDALATMSCSKATNEMNYLASKLTRVAFRSHNIDSCNRT
jgi:formate dehydrogenase major subunit